METANKTPPISESYYPKRIAFKISQGELVLRSNNSNKKCWEVFGEIEDLNGQLVEGFVQCRKCEKVFVHRRMSLSNLIRHKCYVEKYIRKEENAVSIIKVEDSQLECQKVDFLDNNCLLQLMTKWIISDCKSYGIVQDTGLRSIFRELLSLGGKCGTDLDIIKSIPSSSSVVTNVDEMYKQCSNKLREELNAVKDNGFGLTTNIWKDNYTKRNYVALTMHYFKNRALTYCFLGLKSTDGTSQSVCETVETILKNFDCQLSNKSIIVTNNDGDVLEAFPNCKRLPCISHLINNALEKSIEVTDIVELDSACTNLIDYLIKSTPDDSFRNLSPIYSSRRWISIYNMFKSIVSKWGKITITLKNQNESERLKSVNLSHIKSVIKMLQPFEEAIETLEEDSEATLHLVLIYLHELIKFCDSSDSDFEILDFTDSLRQSLQFHLEIIFTENMTIFHKIALFLYPPTNKLLLFSDQQKKLIEDECVRLCIESEPVMPTVIPAKSSKVISTALAKRYKLFCDFVEPEMGLGREELVKQELQCYKNMHISNSEDFDCFNWWEMYKDIFPLLYKLSCWILATPASAAATHQVFTAVGNLLGDITLDVSSNETEIEKMVFINFNGDQDELESQHIF